MMTATCFFLGIVFSAFPYDYPILWSTQRTTAANYDDLESHLKLLYLSPPLIQRILHIVIFLGLAGLISKLYKPSESNMLFDGASLVLYMCGITVYITNIVKGLRLAAAGKYGNELAVDPEDTDNILGREDSLKVLAASNTILGLVLVGILMLQAGQWYAERKNAQEEESFRRSQQQHKAAAAAAAAASAQETDDGGAVAAAADGETSGKGDATATGVSTGTGSASRVTRSSSKKNGR